MKPKKLPVDELLRLACIYAETCQTEWLDAIAHCHDAEMNAEREKTKAFLEQLRAYRLKRWGKTKLEDALENAIAVSVEEVARRPNTAPAPAPV